MRKNIIYLLIFMGIYVVSCNRETPKETISKEDGSIVQKDIQEDVLNQIQDIAERNIDLDYYIETINSDFIGIYLPYEYINSLIYTKNHSLSLHSYGTRCHDVLAVIENMIYSDLKWHDQYAIKTTEADLYKYIINGEEKIIIDNNGYSYKMIGEDSFINYRKIDDFIIEIILSELVNQKIGVSIINGEIEIPFLYYFTGEKTFYIIKDDMFFEEGFNLLLTSSNRGNRFYLGLIIIDRNYYFYELKIDNDNLYYEKSDIIYIYNLDNDVMHLLPELNNDTGSNYFGYISKLTDQEKRLLINTQFAFKGYSFISEEWQLFFNKYSWYEPNSEIRNDSNILNRPHRILSGYLSP